MKESKKSQTFKFGVLILFIVLAGFQFKGGMAADAVNMDSPETGGYVAGCAGDPVIEVYPTGYAPPSGLNVVPTAELSAKFGHPPCSVNEWVSNFFPLRPGNAQPKAGERPRFPHHWRCLLMTAITKT